MRRDEVGGEEFLVIGSRTEQEAAALAERCRAGLVAEAFPDVGQVTASVGVASHMAGDMAWRLLRRADDALYTASRRTCHDDQPFGRMRSWSTRDQQPSAVRGSPT